MEVKEKERKGMKKRNESVRNVRGLGKEWEGERKGRDGKLRGE